jgi:transposase
MLKRTRVDMVREAIEYYLDDLEDYRLGLDALRDPKDAILEWADVKSRFLVDPPKDADTTGAGST